MMQPTQAVQGGENTPSTLTFGNYMPILLTMGEDPEAQHPFWPQYQEKCQDHQEQTDVGVLQLKDYFQPYPEHKNQPPQDQGQVDIAYILQWWDESCEADCRMGSSKRDTLRQTGGRSTVSWRTISCPPPTTPAIYRNLKKPLGSTPAIHRLSVKGTNFFEF